MLDFPSIFIGSLLDEVLTCKQLWSRCHGIPMPGQLVSHIPYELDVSALTYLNLNLFETATLAAFRRLHLENVASRTHTLSLL